MSYNSDPQVILTSPDDGFRRQVSQALAAMRWPCVHATGGADALNKLDSLAGIETVIFDRCLPDLDVDDLDVSLRAHHSKLDVLIVDLKSNEACRSNRTLIHPRSKELAWQLGRTLEVAKPAVPSAVSSEIPSAVLPEAGRAINAPIISSDVGSPASVPNWECAPLPGLVGRHPAMAELARLIRLVAPRRTSVLITGETGTGKELAARAVHKLSPRAQAPFVALNCAAIPEALLESELFGYARGAFTGAMQSKPGRIQAADGGTLFLDEIGELPPALQSKMLRFLQEREIQRLGSNETLKVDVRIVAATHVDLLHSATKPFRQDLYYRLAVFPVALPALRERQDDVLLLARQFLADICEKDAVPAKEISAELAAGLLGYAWPGNVRELQHMIERGFILAQDERVLTLKHLPALDPQNILN